MDETDALSLSLTYTCTVYKLHVCTVLPVTATAEINYTTVHTVFPPGQKLLPYNPNEG